jgi:hypothetical protein
MGELAVLPLTVDAPVSKTETFVNMKGIISREFRMSGKAVSIPALEKKSGLSAYHLRKTIKGMGWVGRRNHGYAPQSHWDGFDAAKPAVPTHSEPEEVQLNEQEFTEAIVHVPEEQNTLCLADVTLEAYYRDIRDMWDTLRHACNDSNLEHICEDIASFKETTRQHLCEVMKKL